MGCTGFHFIYWDFICFTGFKASPVRLVPVLMGFTGIHWVLLGFTGLTGFQ